MSVEPQRLRSRVAAAAMYLGWRQFGGIALGIASVFVVTRLIGPADFGRYATAVATIGAISTLLSWGIGIYLVRQRTDVDTSVEYTALGFQLLAGTIAVGVAALASRVVSGLNNDPQTAVALLAMAPGIPLTCVRLVPLARLERQLRFRRIAVIELIGQLLSSTTMLLLALNRDGFWAPVAGWWVQEIALTACLFGAARFRPQVRWNRSTVREILAFGGLFSFSLWSWQSKASLTSILVGRFLGVEAVGILAVTTRLVEGIGFFRSVGWRLALPALSRLKSDAGLMASRTREAIGLQLLAVGIPLTAFSWFAPWIIAPLFGIRWAPVSALFPWLAIAWVTHSAASLVTASLYLRDEMWPAIAYHLGTTCLVSVLCVLTLPRLGLLGIGIAECAALLSVFSLRLSRTALPRPDSFSLLAWGVIAISLFAWRMLPWSAAAVSIGALALWRAGQRELSVRLGARPRNRVYMVAPHATARGGVAAVIHSYASFGVFGAHDNSFDVVNFPSTRDGLAWRKLSYGLSRLARFAVSPLGPGDIVHVHIGTGSSLIRKMAYALVARLRGAQFVIHVHPTGFIAHFHSRPGWLRRLLRRLLSRASAAIVLTPEVGEFARNELGISRVAAIPNPIDLKPLKSFPPLARDRATVAFVGWFTPEKGVYDLLSALQRLKTDGLSVVAVFAGYKREAELRRHVVSLGLQDAVNVAGWLDRTEVIRLLHSCTVLVLPSHTEGTPMILYEAMACGTPIVSCRVGGIPHMLVENRNALLVEAGDHVALAAAIRSLLENSSLRVQMSLHNDTDSDRFPGEESCSSLLSLYSSLLPRDTR